VLYPLTKSPQEVVAARLRKQARWCARLDSALYAFLLERAAADVESGGACWDVLRGHETDPHGSAPALRFMGAVHRLVLAGEETELARFYPSAAGGQPDGEECWRASHACVERHRELLRELVERPVQTNEVGRSAALVGGFLLVAREFGLPLRLLEVGASAGLNLRWDYYYYEACGEGWGDASSPVRLTDNFAAGRPPFDADARVVERRGCDPNPLNPLTEEGKLTLLSYVWADQTARLATLRGAIEVARKLPAAVDSDGAAHWLEGRLGEPRVGAATVVFHSIVWQYIGDEERGRVTELIERAGRESSARAPLAWLRMEPGADEAEVRLTVWPRGGERLLATVGFHGRDVRWLAV
jgi:hypothetical protein